MNLKEYQEKRNFTKTTEPRGSEITPGGNIFVIQRHQARNLHWDLRLERDGVLKSWAVPKEPPTKKNIRRLAIQTEDHPLEYSTFEGIIPEGEYGAGEVTLWDQGTFETEKWSEEKEIIVHLKGERLTGRYCLIRFTKVKNGWLFFRCGTD